MHAKQLFPATHNLDEHERNLAALIILSVRAPAHYMVLLNTEVIWTDRIATAGTDGVFHYINPDYFLSLPSDEYRAALHFHEISHIILQHGRRGAAYKRRGFHSMQGTVRIPWNHGQYNLDADAVINADAKAHGLPIHETWILRDNVNRDMLVDEVYIQSMLERLQNPEPDVVPDNPAPADDSDQDDDGSDADDTSSDDGSDQSDDDNADAETAGSESSEDTDGDTTDDTLGSGHGGHDEHFEPQYEADDPEDEARQIEEDSAEIARRVDDAIEEAERQRHEARSRAPAPSRPVTESGRRSARESAEAHADWRAELADEITRPGKDGDLNWGRLNRRRAVLYGIASPSRKGTLERIAVWVDMSGSVDFEQAETFLQELAALIDIMTPASGCLAMFVSSYVKAAHEVMSGQELLDLELPKGGGTNMSAALDYMEENGLQADIKLCFTDGMLTTSDMQRLADEDVIMVLDRHPSAYLKQDIRNTGIRTIVATDVPLAA